METMKRKAVVMSVSYGTFTQEDTGEKVVYAKVITQGKNFIQPDFTSDGCRCGVVNPPYPLLNSDQKPCMFLGRKIADLLAQAGKPVVLELEVDLQETAKGTKAVVVGVSPVKQPLAA